MGSNYRPQPNRNSAGAAPPRVMDRNFELKSQIHRKLIGVLNLERVASIPKDRVRMEIGRVVERLLEEERVPMTAAEQTKIVEEVLDEVLGLGPLEPLLKDPTVSDILVNTHSQVFVERAGKYANERVVFDRPIGRNQGVQFPIAESFIEVEAASLMRYKACELFDAHKPCGAEANMAKYLAAKASWEAANVCLQTHGGFGFASEYDIERKFRETRLYQVAPISTNLIFSYIAEHVLGLPRSF